MNTHCRKHPVIFLDFKSPVSVSSLSSARELILSVVQEAYRQHQYLASSDKIDYEKEEVKELCCRYLEKNPVKEDQVIFDALRNLAVYLSKHWNEKLLWASIFPIPLFLHSY